MATSARPRNADSRLLRRTLLANGVLTGISGVILIAGTMPLTSFIGLGSPVITVFIGVVFLLVAVLLFRTAARQSVDRCAGLLYAIIDTAWVVGSVILLLGNWVPFTIAGKWVVGLVAAVVAIFAGLEFYGAWRAKDSSLRSE